MVTYGWLYDDMQQKRPLHNQGRIYTVDNGSARCRWRGRRTPPDTGPRSAAGRRPGAVGTRHSQRTPACTQRRGCRCSPGCRCSWPHLSRHGTRRWCRMETGCMAPQFQQAILCLHTFKINLLFKFQEKEYILLRLIIEY